MNPIHTAIMSNRFNAIVEEASSTLQRTAHTTFVKLVQDFQCGLANVAGEVFAYPVDTGVSAFIGLSVSGGLGSIPIDELRPGDCIITNDPYSTNGMVTHLMDVSLIRPIFVDGNLTALSWAFVHASDIGGAVPGSIAPALTETFQEGLRLRPIFLYRDNKLVESIRDIIMDNSRIPHELWGDLMAMLSALKSMDKRLNQLCSRYGRTNVVDGMEATLQFGESCARSVIEDLNDGVYTFSDYIEGLKPGEYIQIRAQMTVDGSHLTLDFSGSDPQVPAAFNYVTGTTSNPYSLQSLIHYILTMSPNAPRNRGLLRPITVIAPSGTILNSEYPAAGGSRVTTSTRVYDVVLGCLNLAREGGVAAAGPGISAIIVVNGRNKLYGGQRVSVVNPIVGGGGGRNGQDGTDGVDNRAGSLLSVPAETIELETVLRVLRYGLQEDSQAAGQWRGGASVQLELQCTDASATMTVRGLDRFHFRPWGINGGRPGNAGSVVLNSDSDSEVELGKFNMLNLRLGDRVRFSTPSGGGYGNPRLRDPQLVQADIESGLISVNKAVADYGIDLSESVESARASGSSSANALPAEGPTKSLSISQFTFCENRKAYEQIWTNAARRELAEVSFLFPTSIRSKLLHMTEQAFLASESVPTADSIYAQMKKFKDNMGI